MTNGLRHGVLRPLGIVFVIAFVFRAAPAAADDALPGMALWEKQMLRYGSQHCATLSKTKDGPLDPPLAGTYYDATSVFYQIAAYTGDARWEQCAHVARYVYRDRYVIPNNAAVPGYWTFTTGLRRDWERAGELASKAWVIKLSEFSAWARDRTSYAEAAKATLSREVAYALISYIDAEAVGAPPRRQRRVYADLAYGHLDQWFVSQSWRDTADQFAPFMVGLTAQALIRDWEQTADARLIPALRRAATYLWRDAWVPDDRAMRYQLNPQFTEGRSEKGAADLNLLIAPIYAWLWRQTGDPTYRDQGDALFAGGVMHAWLDGPKQFNQSYMWSFDYVRWRKKPKRP